MEWSNQEIQSSSSPIRTLHATENLSAAERACSHSRLTVLGICLSSAVERLQDDEPQVTKNTSKENQRETLNSCYVRTITVL